jgi:polyribonucleotide nucleotidyltransferase
MKPTVITKSCKLPDGREITVETGRLARQADGAVVLRMGNTMILATVVSSLEAKEGTDFLPLSVDYQEKFASTGKVPGGFLKRESRLSDYEILISRLVDRAIRPLFPDDYHADTQVIIYLISGDENAVPDCLAALAASAALSISDIPFSGPISEVRVARIDGKFVINPTMADKSRADIDLIVAASVDNILMVEGEMKEVSEDEMLEALRIAHEAIKIQCAMQVELAQAVGRTTKRTYSHENNDENLKEELWKTLYDKV